jgi:hypothetical protein
VHLLGLPVLSLLFHLPCMLSIGRFRRLRTVFLMQLVVAFHVTLPPADCCSFCMGAIATQAIV